jgi:hypothetical protein
MEAEAALSGTRPGPTPCHRWVTRKISTCAVGPLPLRVQLEPRHFVAVLVLDSGGRISGFLPGIRRSRSVHDDLPHRSKNFAQRPPRTAKHPSSPSNSW